MARCSAHAAVIMPVRLGPSPGTSTSRPGARSITSKVAGPKCSTIRSAILGPIPLINPEPR
jgi:hypothetical protein